VKACWDVSPYPMFLSTEMPEDPRFYSGTLGILRPTYRRSALVAAWRTLVGRPLVDAERRVYVPDPSVAARVSARDVWLNARKTVSGLGFSNSIWQETFLAPTYSYILNCGDSALETAARTLDARRASLGANNPEFVAWVRAQDLVFSNCARRMVNGFDRLTNNFREVVSPVRGLIDSVLRYRPVEYWNQFQLRPR